MKGITTLPKKSFPQTVLLSTSFTQREPDFPKDPGGDISDFQLIFSDFEDFLLNLRRSDPETPLFLFGQSLKGAMAIQLGASFKGKIGGIILINPAYKYSKQKSPSPFTYITFAFNYFFRPSALTVDISGNPEMLSHPEDRKEAFQRRSNPLIVKKFSMRYLTGARRLMQKTSANASHIDKPLLLIYGAKDEIIDHRGSHEIFSVWKCADKEMVILKDAGHGLQSVYMGLKTIIE